VNQLFFLLVAHAICDYPLQGDFLAQAKSRHTAIGKTFWPHALTAHSLIHGGAVAFITGNVWLGLAETIAHWLIDWGKCENKYGIHADQALHVGCKFAWWALA
jgi:hypothetical protein